MRNRRNPSKRRPSALAVAHALWADGKFDEAIRKFNEAVREAPNEPTVLIEAARALGKRYQIERSETLLERALRLAPRAVAVLHTVGETYLMIGRQKKAEACLRRACALVESPQSLLALAKICERRHELDEAADLVARILCAEPLAIPALLLRARLERRRGDRQQADATLRQIIARGAGHPTLVAEAYGELCITLDAAGDYDSAWNAALECKRILLGCETAAWQAAQFVLARCERMIEELSPEHFERWRWTSDDGAPQRLALLTGFPRTGTTLLEQVLDAHPQVVSSEEKEVFSADIFPQLGAGRSPDAPLIAILDEAPRETLAAARQRYLATMEAMLGEPFGGRLHLDKNPAMNLMIPPMKRVFPELKLVIALRDPRDVILSCFLRYLPINPVSVCFLTLERTVERYLLDMGAWLKMRDMTGAWVEIRYERLVSDLRTEAGRVQDALQLPWDDSVLAYRGRGERKIVLSPTYEEVSRPVFTTSVGRWQNYERQLAPVLARLAPLAKALSYEA
jgi:tetratricopeptide (TPR) repeat protein